ncbi:MAG: hypothetical protein A2018_02780 [Alphaproteobacteria bacterium GWF2_58_20]|nr:MAG: hypothetical protein A2018_02780 [Alphaproteobacteria bacterium GWF2_58_20]
MAACVAESIPKVSVQQIPDIPMGSKLKELALDKIVIKVRRGQVIGNLQQGALCIPRGELQWDSGRIIMSDNDFTDAFLKEVTRNGFDVAGNPDAIFGDENASRADLVVGAMIDDIKGNMCWSALYGFRGGDAYVHVRWQVYDVLQRKVVHEVVTAGSSDTNSDGVSGMDDIVVNAFVAATTNLLADEGFRTLVMGEKNPEVQERVAEGEKMPQMKVSAAKDVFSKPSDAPPGVVTMLVRGGHGSGFFISPDGYLLTNYHVVQEADEVGVRLLSGVELVGKVLRRNRVRDVALVKVEGRAFPTLFLRKDRPAVGDDVYAIGAPLGEDMAGTLMRGIVSAWRKDKDDGLEYLQSDVSTNHGNSGGPLVDGKGRAVALCVSGKSAGNAQQNINFFIPVDSALEALSLEVR